MTANSNIVALYESCNNCYKKISSFISNDLRHFAHVHISYFPVATIQPSFICPQLNSPSPQSLSPRLVHSRGLRGIGAGNTISFYLRIFNACNLISVECPCKRENKIVEFSSSQVSPWVQQPQSP